MMNNLQHKHDEEYNKFKSKFDQKLTTQFPLSIETEYYRIISNTDTEYKNVGLILSEYYVSIPKIDSIKSSIKKSIIGKYLSSDSCLLVVNRFDTYVTYQKSNRVIIDDSTLIDRECYEGKYPLPNFMDFYDEYKNSNVHLDNSYVIYVLDANSKNPFENYAMRPSPYMPAKWKNGYSKGIAISEKKKNVIYWSIIW